MLVIVIKLKSQYLEELNNLIIDDLFLLNIYNDGICITQNINDISNLSIFINKCLFDQFKVFEEKSFVTTDITSLTNIEINKNNDEYAINGNISIVNRSCNVCKNFRKYKFKNIDNIDILIDSKLSFLKNSKVSVCNSKSFNGTVLKSNYKNFILYINILLENNEDI